MDGSRKTIEGMNKRTEKMHRRRVSKGSGQRGSELLSKAMVGSCLMVVIMAEPGSSSDLLLREKRGNYDQSVRFYVNDRTCYWNEPCKEEFQSQFRCRCPGYSFCRGPGKYYNAFCDMNRTGYIWMQPETREEPGWRWKDRVMQKPPKKGKNRSSKQQFKMKPVRAMSLEMRKGH